MTQYDHNYVKLIRFFSVLIVSLFFFCLFFSIMCTGALILPISAESDPSNESATSFLSRNYPRRSFLDSSGFQNIFISSYDIHI